MADDNEQAVLRDGIERFARTISSQPLGLAMHVPEPWADIRLCYVNAHRKAEESGGTPLFGWMFQHKLPRELSGAGYLVAIHHAVWRAPTGHLFDVTPYHPDPVNHPLALRGGTLFLVDELAQPVKAGRTISPLPSKFFALDDDERLAAYVGRLRAAEEEHWRNFYAGGPGDHASGYPIFEPKV